MKRGNRMTGLGKNLAESIMYGPGWEEPLNGDEIEELVFSFVQELAGLNGELDDVFVQEVTGLSYQHIKKSRRDMRQKEDLVKRGEDYFCKRTNIKVPHQEVIEAFLRASREVCEHGVEKLPHND